MKTNFSFNPNTHNFWPIYEAIKKYYSIGIQMNEGRGIHPKYNGHNAIVELLNEHIHDTDNFNRSWTSFENYLGEKLNKKVQGTTMGQAPSLSSSIILKKEIFGDCTHSKELHFSVSLLGGFYQIYGVDNTRIYRFGATNVLTTSPYEEFKESFEFLENEIQKKYPDYRIVPFPIARSIINGLEVPYLNDKNCSVNKALFNQELELHLADENIRGDRFYGYEKWKINLP